MSDALELADAGFEPTARSRAPGEVLDRLGAVLDVPPGRRGGEVPLLWHWGLFVPTTRTSELGADGHPRRREPLATTFPRRMFAGGRVTARTPLLADRTVERQSEIARVERKRGSTGDLLLVTVRHRLFQAKRLAVVEEQDIVYRVGGPPIPLPAEDGEAPGARWVEEIVPDGVLLMRFSAVTFNAHRIHFDRSYAREVEGYPDLVVHGPLTALLLAERARSWLGAAASSFRFRATAPAFVGQRLWLTGEPAGDDAVALRAVRGDGATVMEARATRTSQTYRVNGGVTMA